MSGWWSIAVGDRRDARRRTRCPSRTCRTRRSSSARRRVATSRSACRVRAGSRDRRALSHARYYHHPTSSCQPDRAAGSPAPASARAQSDATRCRRSPPTTGASSDSASSTSILLHEAGHIVDVGRGRRTSDVRLRHVPADGLLRDSTRISSRTSSSCSRSPGSPCRTCSTRRILDIPHRRGAAFERGILGGGIGTTIFYLTIGRRGSVSDIDFIARTHGMTKTQSTLLFGGIAAVHIVRISRDPHYANFFARPRPTTAEWTWE